MNVFWLSMIVAVTAEALIEYAKTAAQTLADRDTRTAVIQAAACTASVFLCFASGADLYAALGVRFSPPAVGVFLTGVFTSRGANVASDLIARLQSFGQ